MIDTYAATIGSISFYYPDLPPGEHTLVLKVLGERNLSSSDSLIYLDYIDVWDGSELAEGQVEEVDERIYRSTNWSLENSNLASSGSYLVGGSNAWFPFTGQSVTYQAVAEPSGGKAELFLDGAFYDYLDLNSSSLITRTFTISDPTTLAPGLHILHIQSSGTIYLDRLDTPATMPPSKRHVSAVHSTIDVTSPHRANGTEQSTIVVTVRDASGNPLPDKPVWLTISGTGNQLSDSSRVTLSDGTATFTVTSTVAELKVLKVTVVDGTRSLSLGQKQLLFTGASLSGQVFHDMNRDGQLDGSEEGITGAKVQLFDTSGVLLQSTHSLDSGEFSFSGLDGGTYLVAESDLPIFASSSPNTLTVELTDFSQSTGHLFGDYAIGRVQGQVWHDANQNSVIDSGEEGLSDILMTADDENDSLISTTTDASGYYTLVPAAPLPAAPNNFTFDTASYHVSDPIAQPSYGRNTDFSQEGYDLSAATYPENYNFETTSYVLAPATYPENYNFETGDLTGWTGSNGTGVTTGSHDGSQYAYMNNYASGFLLSSPFIVPTNTQTLHWWWKTRQWDHNYVYIYDESGQQELRRIVNNSGTGNSWREAFADISDFQGQSIRLKFASSTWTGNWFQIDDIALMVSVPNWQVEGNTTGSNGARYGIKSDAPVDGAYAFMSGVANGSLLSPPFTVPPSAQTVRWWWKTRQGDHNYVYIYDESGQQELRRIVNNSGTGNSWREAFADISDFQGQTIRLKFATSSWTGNWFQIDNIALQVSVPNWEIEGNTAGSNGARYGIKSDAPVDGAYAFMSGVANGSLLSPPFTVPPSAQTVRWWWKTRQGDHNYVYIYDESGQQELRRIVNNSGTGNNWREAFADISDFQGQTIRLKFATSSWTGNWFQIDKIGLLVSVPNWEVEGNMVGSNGARYGIKSGAGVDGAYAFMSGVANGSLLSPPFTVPTNTQTLRWWWKTRQGNHNYVDIYDESGEQELRRIVNNSGSGGRWRERTVDISDFEGQTIRLKFTSSSWTGNWFQIDNILLEPFETISVVIRETNQEGWSSSTPDVITVTLRGAERVTLNFGDYLTATSSAAQQPVALGEPLRAQPRLVPSLSPQWPLSSQYIQASFGWQPDNQHPVKSHTKAHLAAPLFTENFAVSPEATITETLIGMANYLFTKRRSDGTWATDHNGPANWWANLSGTGSPAMSAYNIQALAELYSRTGDNLYREALVEAATTMMSWPYDTTHVAALHEIIGLQTALSLIEDEALATQMEARLLEIDNHLRTHQNADGGWNLDRSTSTSDPLPTAGVLYALSLLQPSSTDPVLLSATEYLLAAQRTDGQWPSQYQNNDHPIMTTTWVDISLPWLYEILSTYSINVAHQAKSYAKGLPESFTPPTQTQSIEPEAIIYGWQYAQQEPSQQISFQSRLTEMLPGEVRQISNGTQINYSISGGSNVLNLPALYVQAAHLIRITPNNRLISPAGQTTYDVVLFNPSNSQEIYSLFVSGLPTSWDELPVSVQLEAGQTITVPVKINAAANAQPEAITFSIIAQTSTGGLDSALANLTVVDTLEVALSPELIIADYGENITYTLTITNLESSERTYTLTTNGLTTSEIGLPASLSVGAGESVNTLVAVKATEAQGLYPFQIEAGYPVEGGKISAQGEAVLGMTGSPEVVASLTPQKATGGQGVPVLYTLSITNTGSLRDDYNFTVNLPEGWNYALYANGEEVNSLSLTPHLFNAADLSLIVTPPVGTIPDDYQFSVLVTSQLDSSVQTQSFASLNVTERGVLVDIQPKESTINPLDTGSWQVTVTNSGSVSDTYLLRAGGLIFETAQFNPPLVTLQPGESQVVSLTTGEMPFALQETYPFAVMAESQNDSAIRNQDRATISFTDYQGVDVELSPPTQTLTDSLETSYLILITNTANLDNLYFLSADSDPSGLDLELEVEEVYVPVHNTAGILLTARANSAGTYQITVIATSPDGSATSQGSATLIIEQDAVPTPTPSPTNTPTPTSTPTIQPTNTPTHTPTYTPTPTNTPTYTPTPTNTPTIQPTNTPTIQPTNTPTPTPQAGLNCTYSQGYWKNHAEEWPVTSLVVGNTTYSQADLLDILNTPPRGDATISLAYQLIAAKLNIAQGADETAVATTIIDADNWLIDNPLGSRPKNPARSEGLTYASTLDDYNNGLIGPGHCP